MNSFKRIWTQSWNLFKIKIFDMRLSSSMLYEQCWSVETNKKKKSTRPPKLYHPINYREIKFIVIVLFAFSKMHNKSIKTVLKNAFHRMNVEMGERKWPSFMCSFVSFFGDQLLDSCLTGTQFIHFQWDGNIKKMNH